MATLNPQPDCIDLELLPATPLVPNAGSIRMYATQAGELAAIKADGSNALPSASPGGVTGDLQFNNNGALGNADDVSPGDSASLVSGTFNVSAGVEVVLFCNGTFIAVDNTSSVSLTAPDPGGQVAISGASIFFQASGHYNFNGLQVFANNAAAIAGGLVAGDLYRTGANPDPVCVVH